MMIYNRENGIEMIFKKKDNEHFIFIRKLGKLTIEYKISEDILIGYIGEKEKFLNETELKPGVKIQHKDNEIVGFVLVEYSKKIDTDPNYRIPYFEEFKLPIYGKLN